MHINQFTVDKRLNEMYFKYPRGSLGLKDMSLIFKSSALSTWPKCSCSIEGSFSQYSDEISLAFPKLSN